MVSVISGIQSEIIRLGDDLYREDPTDIYLARSLSFEATCSPSHSNSSMTRDSNSNAPDTRERIII